MKMTDLLRKASIENKEFLKTKDLERFCRESKFDYDSVVKYLVERNYLIRIFRGVFYVRTPEEMVANQLKYTYLELVAKGLELKGVKNWYFGLHTALKLNNLTHEYFAIDDVVNDSISRPKPMSIVDHKFKFHKLSPTLLTFGIKKDGNVKYSDTEKTLLDFIYVWRYNGIPDEKILADISEWTIRISKKRIKDYSMNYPNSLRGMIEEISK